MRAVVNAFTVDVEDYFHVSAFEGIIDRSTWATQRPRVERNTDELLSVLEVHGVQATFFTLGWVAERYPALTRRIVAAGHELASHGYDHTRVTHMSPAQFEQDITRTKHLLEDISGAAVQGYRAPTFSLRADMPWAYDLLQRTGHRYSSSVYPVRHDLYGAPRAPRRPFAAAGTDVLEIPLSTTRLGGRNLPCSGGGFFRLFPYAASRWLMRRVNGVEQQPCVFYIHPWEVDPAQPRQSRIGLRTRVRHYLNLERVAGRLNRLLVDFAWDRMDRIYL